MHTWIGEWMRMRSSGEKERETEILEIEEGG